MTFVVSLLAMTGTALNALMIRWCWPLWIASNTYFALHNFAIREYSQSMVWTYNLAFAVVGWFKWRKPKG